MVASIKLNYDCIGCQFEEYTLKGVTHTGVPPINASRSGSLHALCTHFFKLASQLEPLLGNCVLMENHALPIHRRLFRLERMHVLT